LMQQVRESFRLLRPGGVLAIAHALWRDRVPDNGLGDETTMVYRNVLELLSNSEDFITTLSPIGDGLLLAAKRS
jgi:predicted O-methyltransferase YrrM